MKNYNAQPTGTIDHVSYTHKSGIGNYKGNTMTVWLNNGQPYKLAVMINEEHTEITGTHMVYYPSGRTNIKYFPTGGGEGHVRSNKNLLNSLLPEYRARVNELKIKAEEARIKSITVPEYINTDRKNKSGHFKLNVANYMGFFTTYGSQLFDTGTGCQLAIVKTGDHWSLVDVISGAPINTSKIQKEVKAWAKSWSNNLEEFDKRIDQIRDKIESKFGRLLNEAPKHDYSNEMDLIEAQQLLTA